MRHWVKGSVALGHCALCTTSESLEETQPLANEDGSVILVLDGRVDNPSELRRRLLQSGAVLRDHSDAELMLRAYEHRSEGCLDEIDGDYALVIWDARCRRAFCARDRLGNKPFYYHWDGRCYSFASEAKAILALPWVTETPNERVIAEFLAAEWACRDETLWKDILRLPPAHTSRVGEEGVAIQEYWSPLQVRRHDYTASRDWVGEHREVFVEAVRRMCRSNRPVACEVSGGLDSSSIFAVASDLETKHTLQAPGLAGYTLAFLGEPDADELAYTTDLSLFLRRPIREIPPSSPPVSWYESRGQSHREFPQFPNGAMFDALNREVSDSGCRAILSGVGGDEWLQGSRAYYAEALGAGQWRTLYDAFRIDCADVGVWPALRWFARWGVVPRLPASLQNQSKRMAASMARAFGRRMEGKKLWLSRHMQRLAEERRPHVACGLSERDMTPAEWILLQQYMDPYRQLASEMTEAYLASFGLERRLPFNDARLVEQAFRTPVGLHVRGAQKKWLHRTAMRSYLPRSILERLDKAEFSATFRDPLSRMRELLTETVPDDMPCWLDKAGMRSLYETYYNDPEATGAQWTLWSIFGCWTICRGSGGPGPATT